VSRLEGRPRCPIENSRAGGDRGFKKNVVPSDRHLLNWWRRFGRPRLFQPFNEDLLGARGAVFDDSRGRPRGEGKEAFSGAVKTEHHTRSERRPPPGRDRPAPRKGGQGGSDSNLLKAAGLPRAPGGRSSAFFFPPLAVQPRRARAKR